MLLRLCFIFSGLIFQKNISAELREIIETFYLFQIMNMEEAEEGDSSSQASFVNKLAQKLGLEKLEMGAVLTAEISCPERTSGANILEETSQMINQKEIKKYSCCLVGCVFQVTKYRDYLQHLKKFHSRS